MVDEEDSHGDYGWIYRPVAIENSLEMNTHEDDIR